jgi:hypothetical protein
MTAARFHIGPLSRHVFSGVPQDQSSANRERRKPYRTPAPVRPPATVSNLNGDPKIVGATYTGRALQWMHRLDAPHSVAETSEVVRGKFQ